MPDPEKILDELNRTVDATRKPFQAVRDVTIGIASAVWQVPQMFVNLFKRRNEDKDNT